MENDTVKAVIKKLLWIIVTFIFLESLLITALELVYTLSEYKLEINTEVIISNLKVVFTDLKTYVLTNWEQKNPFFLIGTAVAFLYSIYTHKGKLKKKGWETEDELGYHGSSRWATIAEVIDSKNFKGQTQKQVQKDFFNSLGKK